MNKLQLSIVGGAVILFLILFFGFDTKTKDQKALEKSRAESFETIGIENLLQKAKKDLNVEQRDMVRFLEKEIHDAQSDSVKVRYLKELSGQWYDLKEYALAGNYAQQVAEIVETEQGWSITGTTYAIAAQKGEEEKIKDFCTNKAVQAFENAISLNPENINHRVNIALCYVEHPAKENPMQGISMLLDLNRENPENIPVLLQLARLGIQTGQYDKAILRLTKILGLDDKNKKAICLIAEAYKGKGDTEKAALFENKCLN